MPRIENAARSAVGTAAAAQARRVLKAAARVRRALAARPGGLRDLADQHLRAYPGASYTPHQIGKVLPRSSGAVTNALNKSPMP